MRNKGHKNFQFCNITYVMNDIFVIHVKIVHNTDLKKKLLPGKKILRMCLTSYTLCQIAKLHTKINI